MNGLLDQVQMPAQYTGQEWNACYKDVSKVDLRFAFCFPDTYAVGMSHLGIKILYDIINRRQDAYCERAFTPWTDREEQMRAHGLPLCTLETGTPLHAFDIVAFTLQYELSYTNILTMLDLGGIPLMREDRDDACPLVVAGGPCAVNPEPLADFIDLFMIGDGEDVMNQLVSHVIACKKQGLGREETLRLAAKTIRGVYVPCCYEVKDGRAHACVEGVPDRVDRLIIPSLEDAVFPETFIVPYAEAIHDRVVLEIFRGCTRGCRFCQAGMIYRPIRERTPETLMRQAKELIDSTGYEEIGLCSLSTGDYSRIRELISSLNEEFTPRRVSLSLPSMRLDAMPGDYLKQVGAVRKAGLTFAPEAGTQRLRDVINKNITQEDILSSLEQAFMAGWSSVKLYFMIGLPTEGEADLQGIADMAAACIKLYNSLPRQPGQKGVHVGISASSLVPKPFTPFQWMPQDSQQTLLEKQAFLKERLRMRGVHFASHDTRISFLEATFARGGREMGRVLKAAWQLGCRFDGWGEQLRYPLWLKAFEKEGIDPADIACKTYAKDEPLPWEVINCGVTRQYLWREWQRALSGQTTPDCRQGCNGCGVDKLCEGGCPMCG
nr:TIGR03960 family B12-binding radical SAM protein [bacterium]